MSISSKIFGSDASRSADRDAHAEKVMTEGNDFGSTPSSLRTTLRTPSLCQTRKAIGLIIFGYSHLGFLRNKTVKTGEIVWYVEPRNKST